MPRLQLSTQEMADPGAADRRDADAEKTHGEKALAEDEPEGAHDYRTRVEEAQLPDDVRKVALCEVGKLERTSDQSLSRAKYGPGSTRFLIYRGAPRPRTG